AAEQQARAAAEQGRDRAIAARREAERADAIKHAPSEFGAGRAREAEGQASLGRQDFSAAAAAFTDAEAKFRAAAAKASTPDARTEIRAVLDAFVRAMEGKDLASLQKLRPGLAASDLKKIEDSFRQTKSRKLALTVQSIEVNGDEAVARGRREDV